MLPRSALPLTLAGIALFATACGGEIDDRSDAAKLDAHDDARVLDGDVGDASYVDVSDAGYLDGPLPCDAGGPCFPPPSVIAANQSPSWITVDATNVYWTTTNSVGDRQIVECAMGGCSDAPTALWSTSYFSIPGLAVEGGNVYFPAAPGYVAECAATGCSNTPTNLVSKLTDGFGAFVADGTSAYWNTGSAVRSCALGGCASPVTITGSLQYGSGLAVDATNVYWADSSNILTCPKSGCVGPPTVLVSGLVQPASVAVDATRVYWVEMGQRWGGGKIPIMKYTNGSVMACAVGGCNNTPTVLVSYPEWLGGGAIAADSSGVYWSMEDVSRTFGEIVGCGSGGCGGKAKVYGETSTKAPTVGIALAGTSVFWTDQGLGEVLRAAK